MSQSPSIGRIVHCWPAAFDAVGALRKDGTRAGWCVAGIIIDVTSEMVDGRPICVVQWFAGDDGQAYERMTEATTEDGGNRRGRWWWPPRA